MKLHLPKMLFAAVVMAYSVAEAAVTTVESITIGNETYTGNVSILDNAADITADNLTNVDYVVFKNAIEITNESAISTLTGDKSATIVLAKYTIGEGEEVTPSRLFVNVWNKSTATILNDIVLGTSSHNEGALRLHETSDSKSIILKGNINVVQDTKITVGGGDGDGEHNFLEGYVSATGKTVTIDHINTNSSGVVFSGGGDFGTLTGSVKKITFAATKADGVTEAAGKTYGNF